MKEIVRVHLAKTSYEIEVDAKASLEGYLRDIERMMGLEEAMYEIEARMVELLGERGVAAGGVITAADVSALREQMGEPQDFSDGQAEKVVLEEPDVKPPKRLMRDPDNAILGGVCAGIAAYFGINPLWVRIAFIISPFITVGTSLLIYLVLWISMPEARTAAEKLQMRGEAVTFHTLKKASPLSGQSVAKGVSATTKALRFCLGGLLFIGTLAAMVALIIGAIAGSTLVGGMRGLMAQPWAWGLLGSLVVGGVAAIWLGAALTYSTFTWTLKKPMIVSMVLAMVLGALSVSSIAVFGMRTGVEIARDEKRLTRVVSVPVPTDAAGITVVENRSPQLLVRVQHSEEPLRAELRYMAVDGSSVPSVTLQRQENRLIIQSGDTTQRCHTLIDFMAGNCYGVTPEIIIYGKGLTSSPMSPQRTSDLVPNQA